MNHDLSIVMYHYVKDCLDPLQNNLKGLDVNLFEEQIKFFIKNFNILRMEDILAFYSSNQNKRKALPTNAILLTFDDGLWCHYTAVYPILKNYGLQGSFFIPAKILVQDKLLYTHKLHVILANTAIDDIYREMIFLLEKSHLSAQEVYKKYATVNRYDDEKTAFCKAVLQNIKPIEYRKELLDILYDKFINIDESIVAKKFYLTKPQIQELQENGMYIGIHGYEHSRLGYMQPQQIKEDIDQALNIMKEFIDLNCWVMNYPYGHSNQDTIDYISKKGACFAVTTEPKHIDLFSTNRYLLPRLDCNDFPPKSENYKIAKTRKD